MFKIKNLEGQYFLKIKTSQYKLVDGQLYKISERNDKGKIFQDEKELNKAIKKLTQATPIFHKKDIAYPTYKLEDLIIEKF